MTFQNCIFQHPMCNMYGLSGVLGNDQQYVPYVSVACGA